MANLSKQRRPFGNRSVKTMGGLDKSSAFAKGKHGTIPHNAAAPRVRVPMRKKKGINKEPSQWTESIIN